MIEAGFIQNAKRLQNELAKRVVLEDALPKTVEKIAGVDISNNPYDPNKMLFGSVVLLSYPSLTIKESKTHKTQATFPYIPGLLGFREVPTLLQIYQQLENLPDLIMVDGHGVSHPRGLGIASHLGVLLDVPTIGVAKSILVGKPAKELPDEVGSRVSLEWRGKEIGVCLRTKKRCLPLIISAGHKISLNTAVDWVLRCLKGYRLPEPTRRAHFMANQCRQAFARKELLF